MSNKTVTPNADTILAIQEVQKLMKDPNKKIYNSFSEVLEELDTEYEPEHIVSWSNNKK